MKEDTKNKEEINLGPLGTVEFIDLEDIRTPEGDEYPVYAPAVWIF